LRIRKIQGDLLGVSDQAILQPGKLRPVGIQTDSEQADLELMAGSIHA